MDKNYYQDLEIPRTASDEEIKRAYKNLVKKYHPDNNIGNLEAEIKFKKINEAYSVLSNPDKKKQYDDGMNFTKKNPFQDDNVADDIFNVFFGDDIKQFKKKREEYLKFLDEMEKRFSKYGLSLNAEKKNALNTTWAIFENDNFYKKKIEIEKNLQQLEKFDKERKEYLKFLDEMELEFNKFNKTVKKEKENILNISYYSSLKLPSWYFSNRKDDMEKELRTLYIRKKEEAEFNKNREEYLKFLEEIELEFNKFNRTIIKEKENALNTPYSSVVQTSNSYQYFYKRKIDIESALFKLKQEVREEQKKPEFMHKLKQCQEEVEKRGMNFQEYLVKHHLNESTIRLKNIEKILNSMVLIDQININLFEFGTTFEEFLQLRGKTLIEIKYSELVVINETISKHLVNAKMTGDFDIRTINFEDSGKKAM